MERFAETRAVDELGRVVLPVTIRKKLGIIDKAKVDISLEHDEYIKIALYHDCCFFCRAETRTVAFHDFEICEKCAMQIGNLEISLEP